VHRSPRAFGKPTSVQTLDLAAQVSAAQVSVAQVSVATRVSAETIRTTLRRLGINWERAKH
jgi:hypothetical protein